MSTITREQLITQAQENVAQWRDAMQHNVNTEYAAIRLHLAEIALASLEAEPVAYMYKDRLHTDARFSLHTRLGNWSQEDINEYEITEIPLYTAQPAPVSVPDERAAFNAWNNDTDCPLAGRDAKTAAWLAWSRRAAMLQGADGNSPVIPDGWVACSEWMPSAGDQVLAYRPDAPESNDPLIKMATYVGGSAHGHGFDCYCKPTHWMPLPAAPQQEVK